MKNRMLCFALAAAALAAAAPTPGQQTSAQGQGFASAPAKRQGARPSPSPMPDTGSTPTYTYQRSSRYPGYFDVNYSDGTGSAVVSENYLRLAEQGGMSRNPTQARQMIDKYPEFVDSVYNGMMESWYPPASAAAAEDFDAQVLQDSGTGASATFEPDSQAPPYIRVSLKDASGAVDEFSVSRKAAEMILKRPDLTDAQKLDALKTLPMRLPEPLRENFSEMSQEELWAEIGKDPKIASQEFIRSKQIVQAVQAEKSGRSEDGESTGRAGAGDPEAGIEATSADAIIAGAGNRDESSEGRENTTDAGVIPGRGGDAVDAAAQARQGGKATAVVTLIVLGSAIALGAVLFWRKRHP